MQFPADFELGNIISKLKTGCQQIIIQPAAVVPKTLRSQPVVPELHFVPQPVPHTEHLYNAFLQFMRRRCL
ncbi:hypothetical protein A6M21_09265 [Desulfotomaculum copahuensis]|uniref:Uncharacterized protein n=1 Tax=Desulfotomaculum copahuensis TaxID=1838280 RepID=A0A1B7LFB2_9FIRM|nr:hypothetical protein A6M21_09265 [Desulfotomaculum copahuensis]